MTVSLPEDNADRHPLKVVDLRVHYSSDYFAGDPYTVVLTLNRRLNAFEQRLVEDELSTPEYKFNGDKLWISSRIEMIDAERVANFLSNLSFRGVVSRANATTERARVDTMGDFRREQFGIDP